jgi:AraC family transcriptional regulator
MSELESRARGVLGKGVLKRLGDYIGSNPQEPIKIAALASIAGLSPFDFTRVFARSVGVIPIATSCS